MTSSSRRARGLREGWCPSRDGGSSTPATRGSAPWHDAARWARHAAVDIERTRPTTARSRSFSPTTTCIVREGVRALIERHDDLGSSGVGADYDETVAGATAAEPQVLVTDIRMPPSFNREGIDAAKEVRKRHPGTGVVVLSQYDDPEYAVSLLAEGSAGYGYLLKDHLAEGDQLVDAIRTVATGGTALDPAIVEALVRPVDQGRGPHRRRGGAARPRRRGQADQGDRRRAARPARGRRRSRSRRCSSSSPQGASTRATRARCTACASCTAPSSTARSRARRSLACCPGGIAEKVRNEGRQHRRDRASRGHGAHERHPRVLGDRRARRPEPARRPAQHAPRRDEPGDHRRGRHGHAVRRRRGDGGLRRAGRPGRPRRPRRRRRGRHARAPGRDQRRAGRPRACPIFGLGIGLSTGEAAAALLGSEERLEYTLVGDTVNLSQRLQQFAAAGETVISEPTLLAMHADLATVPLDAQLVKGRDTPVVAFKIAADRGVSAGATAPGAPTSPKEGPHDHQPSRRRHGAAASTMAALEVAGRAQDLRGGERPGARAARCRPHGRARGRSSRSWDRRAAASRRCSTSSPASTCPTRARSPSRASS